VHAAVEDRVDAALDNDPWGDIGFRRGDRREHPLDRLTDRGMTLPPPGSRSIFPLPACGGLLRVPGFLPEDPMPLTFDPIYDPFAPRRSVRLSIPLDLDRRLETLREKLEGRFRIRLDREDLIEYLCEKALERLEDWERRTSQRFIWRVRPPS
jgi:hypothetical protein